MSRLHRLFRNPLVIVVPIIVVLCIVWYQYTGAESQINSSSANIMPNAGLDLVDDHGVPNGWQFSPATSAVTATSRPGYESPRLLAITNSGDATSKNTTLTSPLVGVDQGSTYLYKGFYKSTLSFDLLMQSTLKDGSKKLEIAKNYGSSQQWTTVSYSFTPAANVQSVQFVYSLTAKGELQVDNNYLEVNPANATQPPMPVKGANLLSVSSANPLSSAWSPYVYGDNQTELHAITTEAAPYLHIQISTYRSGEAKWQHAPLSVHGNQAFQFAASYRSDTPVDVIAEYVLTSGERQFSTLTTLQPAKDWTTYIGHLETPTAATSVIVSVVLHSQGTLDTRDYSLIDTSKPGKAAWQRPLLSITFDDGWRSAYLNGTPLLARYNYPATFYLNPSAIDTPSFMTSSQVDGLVAAGHEIASHGYQHFDFTTVSTSTLDDQLKRAAAYFTQVRHQKVTQFATPFGSTDNQVEYVARQYYASLRTTDDGINTRQNFDPYHLLVLYIGKDTPPSKVAAAIADTQATNGWLILVYHRIDTSTEGEPVITPSQFNEHLDIIRKSGVAVVPVGAALHEITAQQSASQ